MLHHALGWAAWHHEATSRITSFAESKERGNPELEGFGANSGGKASHGVGGSHQWPGSQDEAYHVVIQAFMGSEIRARHAGHGGKGKEAAMH